MYNFKTFIDDPKKFSSKTFIEKEKIIIDDLQK